MDSGDDIEARLAAFCSDLSLSAAPSHAPSLIDRCFVDTVGVALAGAARETGLLAAATLTGTGPATVPGYATSASVTDAAFVTGTAAHSLELDDGSPGMFGHPSATLVPPLLAMGEAEGIPGEAAATGYLAGFETMCLLGEAANPGHYEAGWHSTATLGTLGAAAAVATALDLAESETAHALRIAASAPAGLRANFDSATKAAHAGQAARAGLTAAMLAADGFTGSSGTLGEDGGFLDLYTGPAGPALAEMPTLGEDWAIERYGINRKRYPCCYYSQTALVSALELAEEYALDSEAIESVTVAASAGSVEVLTYDDPPSGQAAKFSMPHAVAAALVDRAVGFKTFTDDAVDRADVAKVRDRVSMETDETLAYDAYETTLSVETAHETLERTRELPPGAYGNPLTADEFEAKFTECATESVSTETTATLFELLSSIRRLDDVGKALAPLRG